MIKRILQSELINLSKQYPVVTIIGPRQAGKTTIAKDTFKNYNYVNLELPDVRSLASNDPREFFSINKTPLIIDEIQRVPELLSYIQVFVDEKNEAGEFILTGSNQLQLNETISQSLAGRTALLRLLPLSIDELKNDGIILSRDEYLTKGFLPRIYDKGQENFKAYGNYLQTYIERDLRQQLNIKNLSKFEVFLKLLAGRVGQIVNLHSLSNDVGVTSKTLSEWVSILEASFVIHKIPPYYKNYGKRLLKAPKILFSEIGLVSYLLGIQNSDQVSRDPLLGGMFENLVINEILKYRYNKGLPANLYYYRDNHGREIDLIIEENRQQVIPVEIKSAMTFNDEMSKNVDYFKKIAGNVKKGFVVYAGQLEFSKGDIGILNFMNSTNIFI